MEREEAMCEGDRLKNQAEAFEEMISEVPFQYRVGESKILILNQSPEVEISQEQTPGFSGILLVADKPSLSSGPLKNVTEWNCEICQVPSLKRRWRHIRLEKKHKRKEEKKNCSLDLSPMKPQFIQLVEYPFDDMISGKKSVEGSSGTNDNDQP
ncbi:hypothetical protein H5410_051913 [Solanum commersonii]|uniref:Uncharacterized protein n=1 Tax=Solanum commersonii TaxID=4109 RepID=A0A9J5X238_SOLCO|nr:hypothetical protein H5410_051913 [Solanum commersonii]